ncbi:hypothetical protein BAS06_08530 [Elizabethkingia miricola]|uniref:hypothetical protein n=1 Tax=Elizabethkingia miricola TaxID=172045 RepID=UPI0009995BD4|nr:hypothetical protein [Elizabethkingia miricola]OPB90364.1 hypothetical protein BAS06_08530 [Elizabethkingia miricola]
MSYREFNSWVYKYYLENLIPNQINSLTIPSGEIEHYLISSNDDLKNWQEINRDSWSYLLKLYPDNTPRFLGLIALQCHAAFKMHKDNSVSASNFRERFVELTGIGSNTKLNQLFTEMYDSKLNVQEKIWKSVVDFFKIKNITVTIPAQKSFTGRNTQYPQSQCIINYEDLKEYLSLFTGIDSKYDIIHFDEFCNEYEIVLPYLRHHFRRENNIKEISISESKIKIKQIFDHYVSNEWKNHEFVKKNKYEENFKMFYLELFENNIRMFDDNFEEVTNIGTLFKNKKIIFFKEDIENKREFNLIKKLEKGFQYIFLVEKAISQNSFLENMNKAFSMGKIYSCLNNLCCFLVDLRENVPDFLSDFVGNEYPLELLGLKVSQKRQYFVTNPPIIVCKKNIPYSLYLNNLRVEDNQPSVSGKYIIKVNGFSNYSFEIIDKPKILSQIQESNQFLDFESLEYTTNEMGGMSGFFVQYKTDFVSKNLTIMNWMNAQNNYKFKSKNIIIKAINQSKHGKN